MASGRWSSSKAPGRRRFFMQTWNLCTLWENQRFALMFVCDVLKFFRHSTVGKWASGARPLETLSSTKNRQPLPDNSSHDTEGTNRTRKRTYTKPKRKNKSSVGDWSEWESNAGALWEDAHVAVSGLLIDWKCFRDDSTVLGSLVTHMME